MARSDAATKLAWWCLLCLRLHGCEGQGSAFSPLSSLLTRPAPPSIPSQQGAFGGADGGSSSSSSSLGFISIAQQTFTDETCTEFIPLGFNAWTDVNFAAMQAAARIALPVGSLTDQNDSVAMYFRAAKQAGFNVVRVFGHGNSSTFSLQTGPGQYNETVFRGFDYILAQAGANGMKVIFVIINNWLDASVGGGKLSYCQWAKLPREDLFWSDAGAAAMVKQHLSALSTRKNVFTGGVWSEDTTIFYWELFYEPRCPASQSGAGCPGPVTAWYDGMAQYLQSIDPNHLVSTGEEGFFAVNSSLVNANPWGVPTQSEAQGKSWAANLGQDFEEQHRRPSVDLASFQMWPDNYNTSDADFPHIWIGNHTLAARTLGKPLILSEFGKASFVADESDRIALISSVFQALQASLRAQDSFKGMLFWRWPIEHATADLTTIAPGQPSFQAIQQQAGQVQSLLGGRKTDCGQAAMNVLAFTEANVGK